jgi:hypothetical protein
MDKPNNDENFPLDDAAIATISELDEQEKGISIARNAILSYFLRVHSLTGNWQLAANRRELVRPAPAVLSNSVTENAE